LVPDTSSERRDDEGRQCRRLHLFDTPRADGICCEYQQMEQLSLRSLCSFGDMRARSFGAVLDVGGKSAIDGSLAMAKIERQRLKGSDCEWLS
jgi:hypothetical protein